MDPYDEFESEVLTTETAENDDALLMSSPLIDELSVESIGLWNRLISRTNWEKGRVIHLWRTRLRDAGLPHPSYTDEAWARRVGNVTPQHVGRLRRVFERFGETTEQYPSLFWSHFQAALDWDDAEMWLEGAVQNQWSVAIMRIQRWETLGAPADKKPREQDIIATELDEDVNPYNDSNAVLEGKTGRVEPAERTQGEKSSDNYEFGADDVPFETDGDGGKRPKKDPFGVDDWTSETVPSTGELLAKFKGVKELPEDLHEAFEQLKVAILNHKLGQWKEVEPQRVLTFLNAMRAIVLSKDETG